MKFNIVYFGLAVVVTAMITAMASRRQIARRKVPSSSAAYGGAFGAAAVVVIFSIFHSVGASAWSLDFWTNPAMPGVRAYLVQWVWTGLACAFPAAFVAAKFQRKIRQ